jgi:hypothetical protein
MENNNKTVTYSYSAKQQEELKNIRLKYLPQEENKMEQLRKLDQSVTSQGTIMSLLVGVISALILGLGMSCIMVWSDAMFVPGIIIGLLGIAGIAASYPVFRIITRNQREKLAPQILKLTEELMEQR